MSSFFDVVKELAEQQKMSMAELERRLDISVNASYKWKKSTPNGEVVNKVADVFGVTTDYLYGRSEMRNPSSVKSDDLDKMLDEMKSFNGKPMTPHDREVIRAFLEGKFANK